jgi:hypothetical protein
LFVFEAITGESIVFMNPASLTSRIRRNVYAPYELAARIEGDPHCAREARKIGIRKMETHGETSKRKNTKQMEEMNQVNQIEDWEQARSLVS